MEETILVKNCHRGERRIKTMSFQSTKSNGKWKNEWQGVNEENEENE